MDRACENAAIRGLAAEAQPVRVLGLRPCALQVPQRSRALFRRLTTRYDKLDAVFLAFTHLVFIFNMFR